MRRVALFLLAVLMATATPVLAGTDNRRTACRDQATDIANQWSAGQIHLAQEGDESEADEVVMISGGVKYFVPRYMTGKLKPTSERIWARKKVYQEEFHRCMHLHSRLQSLPVEQSAN
jgi:hypothetical protein